MIVGSARRRTGGSAAWLGGLVLLLMLCGCDGVIETYRSAVGFNKNDPDPGTAPFTGNLDKAETGAYPNLASVPTPPTVATTSAERQALTNSLTGTRTAMQANGGTATPGPVPPPPTIPQSLEASATTAMAQPVPPPKTPLPPLRPMDEPPPPQVQNSTLQTPTIANPPGFAAARPAPAQGQVSPIPHPASAALAPAAVQSGNPQPAIPAATMPPVKPPPEVASHPPPKLPPVPMTVASLDLPPGTAALSPDARPRLGDVVREYRERPRTVRVVSYAAPAVGGAEQLNAFRAALDRAQIVAKELSDAGIPANKIQTEASPAGGAQPPGRIEVQLLP